MTQVRMLHDPRHAIIQARTIALALALLVAATVTPVSAQASEAERVLEQFERALNAHDEEAVVGLFASDSMARSWVRRAAERNLHAHLGEYTSSSDGKTHFTIEIGQGEWYRTGETPMRAQGTAEVRAGRIVTLVLVPVAQAPGAAPRTGPESIMALPLAFAAGSLVTLLAALALLRPRPRPRPALTPAPGTLLSALEAWSSARKRAGSSL
jgi:hypothetical protein